MQPEYLCKDCEHSFLEKKDWMLFPFKFFGIYEPIQYSLKCRKSFVEEEVEPNPVLGRKIKPAHYLSCNLARSKYNDMYCGESAKHWQPRDPKKLFVWIKKES